MSRHEPNGLRSDTDDEAAAFKAFEAAGWGARAQTYARLTGRLTARAIEPLLDAARVGRGVRVLDVGTGTGAIAAAAASRGAAPVGVDLADQMIAGARSRHPHVDFRSGDAEALPFGDGEFDAVVAGFVFNHLPGPDRAAAECARVVAAGGRIAVSVWDEPHNAPFFGVLADAMKAAGVDSARSLPPGPDPYRFADDAEISTLLVKAGFGGVEVGSFEITVEVTDSHELLAGVLGGTVRTATAFERASEAERGRVAAALERAAAPYGTGDGLTLPARVKLACGEKR